MFDLKLKDGRYFRNIDICDEIIGLMDEIEMILDNSNDKMQVYHKNDDEGENLLADITSDDIEYICKAYEYKSNKY